MQHANSVIFLELGKKDRKISSACFFEEKIRYRST